MYPVTTAKFNLIFVHLVLKPEYSLSTGSIPWVLMPWHIGLWCREMMENTNIFLCYVRKKISMTRDEFPVLSIFSIYTLWHVWYNNAPVSWLHWRVIAHYVLTSILDISHWSMTENTYSWTGYLAYLTKVLLRFCNHILKAVLLRDDCDIIVNWDQIMYALCKYLYVYGSVVDKLRLMAQCKTAVTPLLMHWSYCSLAPSHGDHYSTKSAP